jgi:hypothetical protein
MIAALLAALVPSATLAKPLPPNVVGVVVAGTSFPLPNLKGCGLHMQVTYEGKANWLVVANPVSQVIATRWLPTDKSGATAMFEDVYLSDLNGEVAWSFYLADKKLKPVSTPRTVSETWSGDACPTSWSTELARWKALPPM